MSGAGSTTAEPVTVGGVPPSSSSTLGSKTPDDQSPQVNTLAHSDDTGHAAEHRSSLPSEAEDEEGIEPWTPSKWRLLGMAAVATGVMIICTMGVSALNIALPTIKNELNMEESELSWIPSSFSLTYGCFLLLSGRLADVYGRKKVAMVGTCWSAIWTCVGPAIPNGIGFIVTRALAGIGASMALIGIIAANFHGRARATAFATFSAAMPIGAGFSLILGGLLTTYATWKAALWVIGGVSFLMLIAAYLVFPNDKSVATDKRVDWIGAGLVTTGLVFLLFVVSDGQTAPNGWKTPYIIALLIIGVFLVAAFFFWEYHVIHKTTRPPLMRLALWTRAKGKLASVYMIGFTAWMGFTALIYHSTLFYQQVQGATPVKAMLYFLPMTISGIICNVVVAYSIALIPTQILVCIGVLSTGVFFAINPVNETYWRFQFQGMWMCVLGADFLMATGTLFISKLAMPDEQSVAGALFQTLTQLGGAFGLGFTSLISSAIQEKSLAKGKSTLDAQVDGLRAAFWLCAATGFSAFFVAVIFLRGMGTIGKEKKIKQAEEEARETEEEEQQHTQGESSSQVAEKV